MNLSETIRGAGHVGPNAWFGYRVGWPLAGLSVEPDSLTFSMWPVKYRFERSSIRGLVKKRFFGWTYLFIVHTNPTFSKSVVFQPLQFSRLESLLDEYGFALTDEADLALMEPIRYSNVSAGVGFIGSILAFIAVLIAVWAAFTVVAKK
jgi:hypothetical protein